MERHAVVLLDHAGQTTVIVVAAVKTAQNGVGHVARSACLCFEAVAGSVCAE